MILPSEWFKRLEVRARLTLTEVIIWNRGSTHNHAPQMMWPVTERLYIFKRAGDNYELRNSKYSDVWDIGRAKLNGHNAPFPEELVRRVVELWSRPGDLVLQR